MINFSLLLYKNRHCIPSEIKIFILKYLFYTKNSRGIVLCNEYISMTDDTLSVK